MSLVPLGFRYRFSVTLTRPSPQFSLIVGTEINDPFVLVISSCALIKINLFNQFTQRRPPACVRGQVRCVNAILSAISYAPKLTQDVGLHHTFDSVICHSFLQPPVHPGDVSVAAHVTYEAGSIILAEGFRKGTG